MKTYIKTFVKLLSLIFSSCNVNNYESTNNDNKREYIIVYKNKQAQKESIFTSKKKINIQINKHQNNHHKKIDKNTDTMINTFEKIKEENSKKIKPTTKNCFDMSNIDFNHQYLKPKVSNIENNMLNKLKTYTEIDTPFEYLNNLYSGKIKKEMLEMTEMPVFSFENDINEKNRNIFFKNKPIIFFIFFILSSSYLGYWIFGKSNLDNHNFSFNQKYNCKINKYGRKIEYINSFKKIKIKKNNILKNSNKKKYISSAFENYKCKINKFNRKVEYHVPFIKIIIPTNAKAQKKLKDFSKFNFQNYNCKINKYGRKIEYISIFKKITSKQNDNIFNHFKKVNNLGSNFQRYNCKTDRTNRVIEYQEKLKTIKYRHKDTLKFYNFFIEYFLDQMKLKINLKEYNNPKCKIKAQQMLIYQSADSIYNFIKYVDLTKDFRNNYQNFKCTKDEFNHILEYESKKFNLKDLKIVSKYKINLLGVFWRIIKTIGCLSSLFFVLMGFCGLCFFDREEFERQQKQNE